MDDIARELGMSKKTIYQCFTDKNDLVIKTFNHFLKAKEQYCQSSLKAADNPIDEIIKISRFISEEVKGTNPSVFYDLRKYHPDAWKLFENHSNQFIYNQFKNNLLKGMQMGYYRSDANAEIIAQLYISLIHTISNPELFSNIDYEFGAVYMEMIKYHFNGICTESGREYFYKSLVNM